MTLTKKLRSKSYLNFDQRHKGIFCFEIQAKYRKLYHLVFRDVSEKIEFHFALSHKLLVRRKTSFDHFCSRGTVLQLSFYHLL